MNRIARFVIGMLGVLGILAMVNHNSVASPADDEAMLAQYGNRPLDEVSWLVAHNAFVNNRDGRWLFSNQGPHGIRDQLRHGVRGLMLDIYSDRDEAVLCHGSCKGLPLISPRQSLIEALTYVTDFLHEHPLAVVTIFLEDYATPKAWAKIMDRLPNLRTLLFDPYAAGVTEKGWPTLGAIVRANQRLLIFSDRADKKHLGVGYGRDLTVENFWSMGLWGRDQSCRSRWADIPLTKIDARFRRLFVMNHFRDVPTPLGSQHDNQIEEIWRRIMGHCLRAAGRKPNYLAVDFYALGRGGPLRAVEILNKTPNY